MARPWLLAISTVPIPSLGQGPCLRFGSQGTFEPSRYMAGLWAACPGSVVSSAWAIFPCSSLRRLFNNES